MLAVHADSIHAKRRLAAAILLSFDQMLPNKAFATCSYSFVDRLASWPLAGKRTSSGFSSSHLRLTPQLGQVEADQTALLVRLHM